MSRESWGLGGHHSAGNRLPCAMSESCVDIIVLGVDSMNNLSPRTCSRVVSAIDDPRMEGRTFNGKAA